MDTDSKGKGMEDKFGYAYGEAARRRRYHIPSKALLRLHLALLVPVPVILALWIIMDGVCALVRTVERAPRVVNSAAERARARSIRN